MEMVSCAAAAAGRPRSGSGFVSRQDEDASPAAAAVAGAGHHPVAVLAPALLPGVVPVGRYAVVGELVFAYLWGVLEALMGRFIIKGRYITSRNNWAIDVDQEVVEG
ncbi:hypothetical protein QBC33DRAFT_564281 [Phialemonium atrogriseum]|uniref:Uncharacterized protein n=1 Tax=Phialemonium atrogriseum TaxID=1093897 RepID=A0AAJ0BR65_9PEZI|nr:uncharacterized protein QBC33DRAFT_564281 [Phialemonium atrogriseum]KAK1761898.1 hypothetical protein QBC33DRAFT_564281 [Phialemonium atrogriseum]